MIISLATVFHSAAVAFEAYVVVAPYEPATEPSRPVFEKQKPYLHVYP